MHEVCRGRVCNAWAGRVEGACSVVAKVPTSSEREGSIVPTQCLCGPAARIIGQSRTRVPNEHDRTAMTVGRQTGC
ncbi:hypothetical protein J155_01514 [Xanthomonas citri pv. citri]|nr:hypothetical protein J151_01516 [Xanthomonas citri subsp. citri A306]AJY81495.1 hypothetical protein J159_01512 [Xanthomonas citri pv. citri]AJY85917.1 hypothetical protein J158_01512 [Xanthomonas citri subsp. citri UI6]AJY90341.1 hypothetical protein J169_01512 [Xanthomonas citri pv. citri]AJY94812.1 hypothetical protein J164_01512 [Xanthomonas citri pv. citri]